MVEELGPFRALKVSFGSNLKGILEGEKSRRVVKLLSSLQRSEQRSRVVYYFDRKINWELGFKIIVISCSVCHVSIFKKGFRASQQSCEIPLLPHGSEKWVPPIVVTFKKSPFSTSMALWEME